MTTPTGPGILVGSPVYLGPQKSPNPVGQNLSLSPNVFAPAGYAGDQWGANGGGQVAVGGGATDQTGYLKPFGVTPGACETATNYLTNGPAGIALTRSVLGKENDSTLPTTANDTTTFGGSNAG